MAGRNMKELLGKIEVGEAELSVYRARLAARLDQEVEASPVWSLWSVWRFAAAGAAATLLLAVTLVSLTPPRPTTFTQTELFEVEALAATNLPGVVDRARSVLATGDELERWNARMLLCLADGSDCVALAAVGVQEDPRAEFRFLYLEVLLDQADERWFDTTRMEELMDRETDLDCLRLYERLFHLVA